jgi:hypothetical protein
LASSRGGALATPARSPSPRRAPAQAPRTAPRRAPAPIPQPRPEARRAGRRVRAGGAIAWISVGAVLLAGVVFINLAVLRLNLRLERATQTRAQLRAQNAALESALSSALASGRIQQLAQDRDGLVQADPSSIGYITLGR